jgi:LPS-assembly lipoprotein
MRRGFRSLTFALCIFHFALALSACGFHLRGTGSVALPESLSRLRVMVLDSKLANDPLLVAMTDALRTEAGVTVTGEADAPTLELYKEQTSTHVQSVSVTGRASGYALKYEVSYRLADAAGKQLLEPQSVRLLRDYTFDPVNVLAKEEEEQELVRTMQRDAVQQILRRLSRAPLRRAE